MKPRGFNSVGNEQAIQRLKMDELDCVAGGRVIFFDEVYYTLVRDEAQRICIFRSKDREEAINQDKENGGDGTLQFVNDDNLIGAIINILLKVDKETKKINAYDGINIIAEASTLWM